MKFILAKKVEMSQIFDDAGSAHPITWLQTGPLAVTQVKSKDSDGYEAVQVGFGAKKQKKVKKPQAVKGNYEFFREFRLPAHTGGEKIVESFKIGDEIKADVFDEGEVVDVSGISKGKGFQGVVKRHGFHGGRRTHGQKHSEREPGSIGATWPQRVLKGKKMAGRMGGDRITVQNLKIIKIMPDQNLIAVGGAVPGRRGSLIELREAVK
jgi:large subunit ribosomal protein L3